MDNVKTCPQCGRVIKIKSNRFGDEIFSRHKMARLGDYTTSAKPKTRQRIPDDLHEELFAPNPLASASYDIDCPMGGQPL